MPPASLNVGVVYGGRSVEHDVSIITGLQACEALRGRHTPVPIYIDRDGRWFSDDSLLSLDTYTRPDAAPTEVRLDFPTRSLVPVAAAAPAKGGLLGRRGSGSGDAPAPIPLDVVLPATHGTQGEDGALQGLLELADIAYAGPPLEAAVVAMNKALTKLALQAAGLPVVEHLALTRTAWSADRAAVIASIAFPFPVYVKPASLGSSVGVSRCADPGELADALELAFELDRLVLVEPAIEGGKEVNCAVLGRPGVTPRASTCEEPIASAGLLSFEDKYLRDSGGKGGDKSGSGGGAKGGGEGMASASRIIPAPIGDELTARVQELAKAAFTAIGGAGVTRVDFLLDADGGVFVNECNTIPGSFAFYLWEHAGLPFEDLMDELVALARAEFEEKRRTTRVFESNLLAKAGGGKAS